MDVRKNMYCEIISPVESYSLELNNRILQYFENMNSCTQNNNLVQVLTEFLASKGKKIRSNLIFLITKALGCDITQAHYNLALVQEFIHNATLIHDDIIDCSEIRRGNKTLNFKYDSKFAVLAGDYLLSEAMQLIDEFESAQIRKIHSSALKEMINGEINQYFNRFKVGTIEEYVEKSKAKTARLFECGIVSAGCLNNIKSDCIESLSSFALNFGTAFQIRNDIDNLMSCEKINEDIRNGDYSAPVIFYFNELGISAPAVSDFNNIFAEIKASGALEKTNCLIEKFSSNAIENIAFLEDNLYKQSLIDLCRLLCKGRIF